MKRKNGLIKEAVGEFSLLAFQNYGRFKIQKYGKG